MGAGADDSSAPLSLTYVERSHSRSRRTRVRALERAGLHPTRPEEARASLLPGDPAPRKSAQEGQGEHTGLRRWGGLSISVLAGEGEG